MQKLNSPTGATPVFDVKAAVRELRTALGDTQQQFANRLGLAISTVVRYELTRSPKGRALASLLRLARESERFDLADVFAYELGFNKPDTELKPVFESEAVWVAAVLEISRDQTALKNAEEKKWIEARQQMTELLAGIYSRAITDGGANRDRLSILHDKLLDCQESLELDRKRLEYNTALGKIQPWARGVEEALGQIFDELQNLRHVTGAASPPGWKLFDLVVEVLLAATISSEERDKGREANVLQRLRAELFWHQRKLKISDDHLRSLFSAFDVPFTEDEE